jgi:glycosyltransferase involved in cell wall biosynthesis
VLAPAITGIPELVIAGKTGFLYEAGSQADLVAHLRSIHLQSRVPSHPEHHPYFLSAARQLDWIRHAARVQVWHNFNRGKNLESFSDVFLKRIVPQAESVPDENLVLQQI